MIGYAVTSIRHFRLWALAALVAGLALPVPGHASGELVRVPVLARNVGADEIIGDSDIAWASVPARQVRADVVTDPVDILGLSPRRSQLAGRVLRRVEFAAPIAIKKGAYVTMMLRQGALLLTAQGRALEEGAIGDTIRVLNTDSKQTIAGEISAPGVIVVRSRGSGMLAAIN